MRRRKNKMNGSKPKNKYLWWILLSVMLILIAGILEYFISNYRTLFIQQDQYVTDVNGLADGVIQLKKDKDQTYTISNPPGNIYAIQIDSVSLADEEFMEPVKVIIQAYDIKRTKILSTVQTFYIAPGLSEESSKIAWMDLELAEGTDIKLSFYDPYFDAEITGVTINPSNVLRRFHTVRFLVIALILFVLTAIRVFRLGQIIFDHGKVGHRMAVAAILLLCILLVTDFMTKIFEDAEPISYPLIKKVSSYNPYVQQTDAFIKGQLHIDYPVSEELLSLENPYDRDARSGLSYLYDRAMYDGKYYSYFGIAPILNVYLPHYAIKGTLPAERTVKLFYALMGTVFSCLFLAEYVIAYKRRVPLLMLLCSILAFPLVSNILLVSRGYNHFYYTAVLAGMSYLAAFLFFILRAMNTKGKVRRPVLFAIAGLSYAMLFLSRLNMALLTAFIVVPIVVYGVFLRQPAFDLAQTTSAPAKPRGTTWFKENGPVFIDLACLAACVLIALVFSLWYNNARFDSPFEFGTKYQLTVSDVSKNKLSLAALPNSIYHYFFQPLGVSSQFPYFSFLSAKQNSYGGYVYVDANCGLFEIPVMLALVLVIPLLKSKEKTKFAKVLAVSLILGCLIVSWMNFCLGGVIFRYTSDMTLLCALGAFMLLFSYNTKLSETAGEVTAPFRTITYVVIGVSVYICLNLLLQINGNLVKYPADAFVWISDFLGH